MTQKRENERDLLNRSRRRILRDIVVGSVGTLVGTLAVSQIHDPFKVSPESSQPNTTIVDIPKEKFSLVEDLERWRRFVRLEIMPDIYNGFIFPAFRCQEINEIKFLSTSLVWGHATLGLANSRKALIEINDTLSRSDKNVLIVFNSDFIEKLSSSLNINSFIDDYDAIMGKLAKGSSIGVDEYSMLLSTKRNGFFKVRFLNDPPNVETGVVSFNGKVEIEKL